MSINSLNVYISFLKLVKLYFQLKWHGSKFNVPCPSSNSLYLSTEQDIGLHIAISVIIFTIQL